MAQKGMLVVISAPAGCGKDTIVEGLFNKARESPGLLDGGLCYSVSTTTREIRDGETDGKHYFFTTHEKFCELIKNDEFLEFTEYCDNYYGTRRKTVNAALKKGENIILKIEIEGAKNVKALFPNAVLIFILPPSFEELRCRLENRQTETPETIQKRLAKAKVELAHADKFDYNVINDDLQTAIDEVFEILMKERNKAACL